MFIAYLSSMYFSLTSRTANLINSLLLFNVFTPY
nr:MAG TPA: hypothetical protein [Caudoviricetes sp.]